MAVERYQARTLPDAAAVAKPGPSPIGTLANVASALAEPVLKRLDERSKALEHSALSRAQRDLETQGLQLEIEAQKEAGPGGDGYVPLVQQRREKLRTEIWEKQPESIRRSERAKAAWDAVWDNDDSQATRRATLWQSEQETKFATDGLAESLNGVVARIEADPDSAQRELAAWKANLGIYEGFLGKARLDEIARKSDADLMLASVRGLAKSGRFDDATDVVNRIEGALDAQTRAQTNNFLESERGQAQGRSAEDMQLRIQKGELTLADIDAGLAAKTIDAGQATTLRGQIQGRNAEALQTGVINRTASAKAIEAAAAAGEISPSAANTLRLQNQAMIDRARAEIDRARAQKAADDTKALNGNYEALRWQVVNGLASEADIMLATQGGYIGLDHSASLLSAVRQGAADRSKLGKVMSARADGIPLNPYDPDTRAGIDLMWDEIGGAALFTQNVEMQTPDGKPAGYTMNAGAQAVLQVAREVGVIPPGAASALQGLAINGDDQQKQTALDAVAQLWEQYPGAASAAFPDGQDRILKDAISFATKTAAGLDPVAALRAIERENTVPGSPVLKQRQADALKLAKDITGDKVRGALKEGGIPFLGDAPPLAPGAEAGAIEMMREAYTTEYLRTGDAALAEKTAAATVKRVLGATEVGSRATMAYPPERYYAPGLEQMKPGWLGEQLVAGVQEYIDMGGLPGVPAGTTVAPGELRLLSDGQTAREVREQQPPSYMVEWRGEVLPERWKFDPGAKIGEIEAESADRKREGEVQRALKQSGLFNDPEAQLFARTGFRDRKQFDDVLKAAGGGHRGAKPGQKLTPATPDTLWQQLEGIGAKYKRTAEPG